MIENEKLQVSLPSFTNDYIEKRRVTASKSISTVDLKKEKKSHSYIVWQ